MRFDPEGAYTMDIMTLSLFCLGVLICVISGLSTLWALGFGLLLFLAYGKKQGHTMKALMKMCLDGIKTVKNILLTFVLIGIMTALWRASGTIPAIVCYAARLIRPTVFLPLAFILCCAVSYLTGTSFGTAATMGVICAAMGSALGVDIRLIGGAILSGSFFGDRCSPVSTSALLVADITGTDIFTNIRRMMRSSAVPFFLSCTIFCTVGLIRRTNGEMLDLETVFAQSFSLHWLALIPALVILFLSFFRVNVKIAMGTSILSALPLCIILQKNPVVDLIRFAIYGFSTPDPDVAKLINGGGLLSMLRVAVIVCLSSAYAGIFQNTGLLDRAKDALRRMTLRTGNYSSTLIAAVFTSMIACNQSLATLLTEQLCGELYTRRSDMALDLEDTVIVIAPLIPWSIAGAVPLASIGAPDSSIFFAVYLYLLPLYRLVCTTTPAVSETAESWK